MNVKPILGLALLGLAATLSLATPSEAAMPAGTVGLSQSPITLAVYPCGPYRHPNGYGVCVPNRPVVVGPPLVGPPLVGPPVVVAPRACPYGYHLGPYGRRCLPNGY